MLKIITRLFIALNNRAQCIQKLTSLPSTLILPALVLLTANPALAEDSSRARLVLIIDDIGNHFELGQRAIELPGKLNYAVLPHTPQATRLANYAAAKGPEKEVLLHMPMEAMGEQLLGPAGLYNRLDRPEFTARIDRALKEVPNAVGISNHMGSLLTQQRDKMNWLMAELERRNLYFIDSKTTGSSSAKYAAAEFKVPYLAREYFLDHKRNAEAMESIMKRAIANAKADGLSVVIGHPYRSTLSFLEQQLPSIKAQVELIKVSEALGIQTQGQLASID